MQDIGEAEGEFRLGASLRGLFDHGLQIQYPATTYLRLDGPGANKLYLLQPILLTRCLEQAPTSFNCVGANSKLWSNIAAVVRALFEHTPFCGVPNSRQYTRDA